MVKKKPQKLVNVVCERPLIGILCMLSSSWKFCVENFASEPWAGECTKWGYLLFEGFFLFSSNVVLTRFFVIDRELRSGLSMSFILLLLRHDFVKFLYEIRKPESHILDKKTVKSYLG